MDSSSETHARPTPSHPIDPGGFAPGTILADRYRIVALAGRGGMGEVYRADDLKLGQTVALKFLPEALEHDTVARERLLAEVRSARTVSHPNVCRVYDVGDVSGRVFLTMEYIDGEDLASLLRRIGRLPAAKALEVARQLCAGLAAAHDKGLLHRDLKPANVMIDGRGHARITDFGLAAPAATGESPADQAGTVAYMAPERFEGRPATVQSDLYALGLILYETYTGKPAFKADSFREWQRVHTDSTPTSPAALATDVEPAVERAILRCLEKDPTRRPKSAAQVAAALPGGDPLAAAIAAGETPSPELVAASGEEGTLPRWQAWARLAACLVALAVVFAITSSVSLANLIPLQDPVVLKAKAQSVLRDLGYRDPPVDSFSWSIEYPLTSGGFNVPVAGRLGGPIRFGYRQSSESLLQGVDSGWRGPSIPAPYALDDAFVELNARDGRLTTLRVGGVNWRGQDEQPAPAVNWKPVLAAAGLDETQLAPADPAWSHYPFRFDALAAWQYPAGGGRTYRVEAAAYRGRVAYFGLWLVAIPQAPQPPQPTWLDLVPKQLRNIADMAIPMLAIVLIAALAALAHHNLRAGRGDRKGAWRVAMLILVSEAIAVNLRRRWGSDVSSVYNALVWGQGQPFFLAVSGWLSYLGFEPFVRRRWPQLLVTSTRLLDGRWRDALVGRSVLIGVIAGSAFFGVEPIAALASRLPGMGPVRAFHAPQSVAGLDMFLSFLAGPVGGATMLCLDLAGLLLVARVVFRDNRLAWTAVALAVFLFFLPTSGLAPVLTVSSAAVMTGIILISARAGGLLATLVLLLVWRVMSAAPLTLDVGRWYVWRSWFVVAVVVGLALWGFRNVLGKQSAFPAGALDG